MMLLWMPSNRMFGLIIVSFLFSLPDVRMESTLWFGSNYIAYHAPVHSYAVKPLRFDYFNPMMMAWGGLRAVEEVLMITDNSLAVGAAPRSGRIAGVEMKFGKQKAASAAGAPEYMALKSPRRRSKLWWKVSQRRKWIRLRAWPSVRI